MRIHHFLAASTAALFSTAPWAQTSPALDPTGALWIGEQIAAARRAAPEEVAGAQARQPMALRVAATKDSAPRTAEFSRPGHVTRSSTATIAPFPEGAR